jgi:tetratricopeptide (TPR) repeat protein
MKKTTAVALLLLASNIIHAKDINPELGKIESQWATIYYAQNNSEQKKNYSALLKDTTSLLNQHTESTELMIWQAILISNHAAFENPFSALDSINKAKKILETVIRKKPNSLDGAAFVVLGTLYYMTPSWPISFGDQDKAQKLLKTALKINPNSIDANYFYADYLLSLNEVDQASKHFKLAIKSPIRQDQAYADNQLKQEAFIALKNTQQRKLNSGKNKFLSLFSIARTDY